MNPTDSETAVAASNRTAPAPVQGIRTRLVTVWLGSTALALGAMLLAPLGGSTSISLAP